MLRAHCTLTVAFTLAASSGWAEQAGLVDFRQHIQPILEQHCLQCHGPSEAKNGLRVDELEDGLLAYIEPGDAAASSLWTDYLRSDDPDMIMPPPTATEPGGLPVAQLLLIKAWIDEGATGQWHSETGDEASEPPAAPASNLARWWAFQGLFHPASVHFPVALLSVSALFVLLSFFNRQSCEPVAFHCLWIGALGAVVACVAGWSYAVYRGYGAGVGFDLAESAIDRHRWAGVFVAVFGMLTIPLAARVRRTGSLGGRLVWLFASLILAGVVSITGYQGGELTYGEDHYWNYYRQLFPAEQPASAEELPVEQPAAELETESTRTDSVPAEPPAEQPVESDPTESPATEPEPAEPPSTEPPASEPTPAEPTTREPAAPEDGNQPAATETSADPPFESPADPAE